VLTPLKSPAHDPPAFAPYDRATMSFYADQAAAYAASARSGPSRNLGAFLERLQPGARILELGCGDGRDSEAMLSRGFDVDATDGSEAMAKEAEIRLNRPVRVMRFDELVVEQAYDGVWANASLLHAPRPSLADVLSRIFTALRPGGFHFASYKTGEREGRDGLGRYFNYLSIAELEAVYRRSAPWVFLSVESALGGDYEGGERPWAAVTVRRAG
jgi:2-polyprenyl-3-methyl-5-hydroxy-6-metoxy-1,4-benzoquinol methylase